MGTLQNFLQTIYFEVIGVRAKRARHSQVCSIENRGYNWASEASPTLGCSIEISRDIIYMLSVCRMSVVCQINCVGGITYGPRACSKSFFGG